ncbi:MAG: hypothetical protein ABSG59_09185 [Verrucomicrobiota bacterium]
MDDNPVYAYAMPVAFLPSNSSAGLGFLGQTDPILINAASTAQVLYTITSMTGIGITSTNAFTSFQQIVDNILTNYVSLAAGIFGLSIGTYQKAFDLAMQALGYASTSPSITDCHGPTFFQVDTWTGARLAELTAGYVIHRPPTYTQGPLGGESFTSQSGCGTPSYRINVAIECAPPELNVVATNEQAGAATIFVATPYQDPQTIGFDFIKPPGIIEDWISLGGSVVREMGFAVLPPKAPGTSPLLFCFALGNDLHSIWYKWRDSNYAWHPSQQGWTQLPGAAIGGVRALSNAGQIDLFVTGTDGLFYHALMGADGSVIQPWTASTADQTLLGGPNAQEPVVGPPFVVLCPTTGFNVFGVQSPNYYFSTAQPGGHIEAGGFLAWQTFTSASGWVSRSQNDTGLLLGQATLACTLDINGEANLVTVGRTGIVDVTMSGPYDFDDPTAGGVIVYYTGFGLGPRTARFVPLGQATTNNNPAAAMFIGADSTYYTWVAFIDQNKRLQASMWLESKSNPGTPGADYVTGLEGQWCPSVETGGSTEPATPGTYNLGGTCIGRPVILPYPEAKPNGRVYFFVLSTDEKVYWKYCQPGPDPADSAAPLSWANPTWFPSQVGWAGPVVNVNLMSSPKAPIIDP